MEKEKMKVEWQPFAAKSIRKRGRRLRVGRRRSTHERGPSYERGDGSAQL